MVASANHGKSANGAKSSRPSSRSQKPWRETFVTPGAKVRLPGAADLIGVLPGQSERGGQPLRRQPIVLCQLHRRGEPDLGLAGGVRVDTLADKAEIVPGETFTITVSGITRAPQQLKPGDVALKGPAGWKVERVAPASAGSPGSSVEAKFRVTVPPDAPVSQPYWLVRQRVKDRFNVPPAPWDGDLENPPLFTGSFEYSVTAGADPLSVKQEAGVVYRYADRIYGEREKPLTVVPAFFGWFEPSVSIFPTSSSVTPALLS